MIRGSTDTKPRSGRFVVKRFTAEGSARQPVRENSRTVQH